MAFEKQKKKNLKLISMFEITNTAASNWLVGGGVQVYLLAIGFSLTDIAQYGIMGSVAAMLAYACFTIWKPKHGSYLPHIFIAGMISIALPLSLILCGNISYGTMIICLSVAIYQFMTAIKSSGEYSSVPLLSTRKEYKEVIARNGMVGSLIAFILNIAIAFAFESKGSIVTYRINFAFAIIALLICSFSVTGMKVVNEEEQKAVKSSRFFSHFNGKLLWLLVPHFVRGIATAGMYYFVAAALKNIELTSLQESLTATVSICAIAVGCWIFMSKRLQKRLGPGAFILLSTVVCALAAVLGCLIHNGFAFLGIYFIYTTASTIVDYAIPMGVIMFTKTEDLPFISGVRMLLMHCCSALLSMPLAKLLDGCQTWVFMLGTGLVYMLMGVLYYVQYKNSEVIEERGI